MARGASRETLDELLAALARPGADLALRTAERLQKHAMTELVVCVQRWLYDLCSLKMSGNIRYYPKHRSALCRLAEQATQSDLLNAVSALNRRRASAEHPLSPKLFIEDMLLDYAQVFSREV